MIYKPLHRIIKIEQHEPYLKRDAPKEYEVPAPHVASVMLILL